MKIRNIVLLYALANSSVAQINLSSIFSDAQSIYTAVTSALGAQPTSTISTTSTSSSTTSSSTPSSSSSEFTSASSASAALTPTTSSAVSSATSAASTATSTGNGSSNTLPIVLGCTLGALALAAFLALFLFCRRRRSKRSKAAAQRRDLPTSDDESDIWNREKHNRSSFKGPTESTRVFGTTANNSAAPLMTQHGYGNQHSAHGPTIEQSSYGPTPSIRRYTSATDAQKDDPTAYTAHPFSPDHVQSYGYYPETQADNYHRGDVLAAGAGGVALGALASHDADRHDIRRSDSRGRNFRGADGSYTEDEHNTLPEATIGSGRRSSGSVSRASAKEPWPFVDGHERRSNDSTRSRARSFSRGRNQFGTHEQETHDQPSMPSGAAIAGSAAAGGLAGAAVARGTGSNPHRKGILKQTTNPANVATQDFGPHELESFEVPPPITAGRERRHSPLGTAAPVAAIGANRSPTRSGRKSWSNDTAPENARPGAMLHDSSQDSDIPVVPSRSPRRNSVHSNARYSAANEGTVELPGSGDEYDRVGNRQLVSPSLEPHRMSMDNEAVVSPISPDTSQPGTWSKAHAEELGMSPAGLAAQSSSQGSTSVGYSPLNSNSTASTSSTEHSSGLVSAIQRIFNSQKQAWPAQEITATAPPRRSFGDRTMPVSENVYEDNQRVSSVPHRKPASATSAQYAGQYNQTHVSDVNSTEMPGQWTNETTPLANTESRKSVEAVNSNPVNRGQFSDHANSVGDDKTTTSTAASMMSTGVNESMNTGRARSTSRPGYGIGSGDPFDLARIRAESNMAGISPSNYTEPTNNITNNNSKTTNVMNSTVAPDPHAHRTSNPSHEYREPTLAELRREVEEEDRQRRASWKSTGRRSNTPRKSTEGQRYGNDGELFDLAFPGSNQYDHFYGQGQPHTGAGVGTAY